MSDTLFEFQGATLGYRGNLLLRDLSLSLATGDFLGIVGPNGAGKSTLVKTMLGLLPLRDGRMAWLPGRPRIGYVPQRDQIDAIWPMRVRDTLALTLSALWPYAPPSCFSTSRPRPWTSCPPSAFWISSPDYTARRA